MARADTAVDAFDIREVTDALFPHGLTRLRVIETHISWIVLTGSYAYKIKKPVRFDFLDAATLERRRALCDEELRLNRRLAPDLYVDVLPIVRRMSPGSASWLKPRSAKSPIPTTRTVVRSRGVP